MADSHEALTQLGKRVDYISSRVDEGLEHDLTVAAALSRVETRQQTVLEHLAGLNGATRENSSAIATLIKFTIEHPNDCPLKRRVEGLECESRDRKRARGLLKRIWLYLWAALLSLWAALCGILGERILGSHIKP